jgi:hypothetical protein
MRNCPVCGSEDKSNFIEIKKIPIETVSFLSDYKIVNCLECGMVYADGIVFDDLDNYYEVFSKYYDNNYAPHDEIPAYVKRFADYIIDLCNISKIKNIRIVDVGCGQGMLLRELYKRGYKNLVAVDVQKNVLQKLQEELHIETWGCSVYDITNVSLKSDIIVLS